eukprot:2112763-Alexandrium_andersonii.AAC.1
MVATPGGCASSSRAQASNRPSTSARLPSSGGSTGTAGAAGSGRVGRPLAQACTTPSTRRCTDL